MQDLIPDIPAAYQISMWSPQFKNATPFNSSGETYARKKSVADTTGTIEQNGKWYAIKG
jgi:hypothetical protein